MKSAEHPYAKFAGLAAALAVAPLLIADPALAVDTIEIDGAFVEKILLDEPTPVYLTIRNYGNEDELLAAASTAAVKVELRDTVNIDGVMTSKPVKSIQIPTIGVVSLAPGGKHLMFYSVSDEVQAGQSLPLILKFRYAGAISTNVLVQSVSDAGDEERRKHMHGHKNKKKK